jgi:hypothetical protein
MMADLDQLWSDLLSEDPTWVAEALLRLPREERQAALAHLHAMGNEPGWSDGQARRARTALAVAATDPRLTGARPES